MDLSIVEKFIKLNVYARNSNEISVHKLEYVSHILSKKNGGDISIDSI
jgi:hypothetical protein